MSGNSSYFLDTGYLVSTESIDDIPRSLYKEASEYVKKTRSAGQRDVLAAHIGQNIFL